MYNSVDDSHTHRTTPFIESSETGKPNYADRGQNNAHRGGGRDSVWEAGMRESHWECWKYAVSVLGGGYRGTHTQKL